MDKKQLQNTVQETPIDLDGIQSKKWEKIKALPQEIAPWLCCGAQHSPSGL